MIARVSLDVSAKYVMDMLVKNISLNGIEVGEYWHDDNDFIMHIKMPRVGDVKFKFQIIAHEGVFLGFKLRRVVVSNTLPISGKPLGIIMDLFKSAIERSLPFAEIKTSGETVYLENIKTDNIMLKNGQIAGELFIGTNL